MNMRHFLNILLREAMTPADAKRIFASFDIDTSLLDKNGIKSAYRKAAAVAHPDRGGDPERMKMLNAAFDVLKDDTTGNYDYAQPRNSDAPKGPPKADFHHIDYVKHYFRELSKGKTDVQMWTVWNFDGHFQRGVYTIPASPEDFPEVAKVMKIWDRFYDSKAIFVSRGRDLFVISIDGQDIAPTQMPEHESFNDNWSNDQSFMRRLPAELKRIQSEQGMIGD